MKNCISNFFLIVVCTLFCISAAKSQTSVPAGNVSGTWTLANSPYNVQGDVVVPDGTVLNIEAGVEVVFCGQYKFTVEGNMQAVGTETQPIMFTPLDTTVGWLGLRFPSTADGSNLVKYATIQYGKKPSGGDAMNNHGGGITSATPNLLIENCVIEYCDATHGGGVHFTSSSTIRNSIVRRNYAADDGGGIACQGGDALIENCLIIKNYAANGGGSVCGGGIRVHGFGSQKIVSCTIADNQVAAGSPDAGVGVMWNCDPLILNCIIWNNGTAGQFDFYNQGGGCDGTQVDIINSDIQGLSAGGGTTQTGVINADPLFVDPANDNYHLQTGSPCINTGSDSGTHTPRQGWVYPCGVGAPASNTVTSPANDLEAFARPFSGTTTDMGAYEYGYFHMDLRALSTECTAPCTGTITGTVILGTAPYTYAWSNGATTKDLANACSGTYTVTVTDMLGAIATAQVYVGYRLQTPTADLNVVGEDVCFTGTTIDVSFENNSILKYGCTGSSNPYSFEYGDGATATSADNTTQVHTYTATGTYTAQLIAKVGSCADTATYTFAIKDSVLVLKAASICSGGSYTLADGTVVTAPGTYDALLQTAGGCDSTIRVTLTANPRPTANAGPDRVITCTATSVTLAGSVSPAGSGFQWAGPGGYNNTTNLTPTITTPGTYTLGVQDANGCTATDQVVVTQSNNLPVISAGPDRIITCSQTNALLSGTNNTAGATIAWAGPGGYTSSNLSNIVTTAGTYTLTVTNTNNGCSAVDQMIVTVNNTPPTVSIANANIVACPTGSFTVTATGTAGGTYTWTGPNGYTASGATITRINVTASMAGTYTVKITNPNNGCTATATANVSTNGTDCCSANASNITATPPAPCSTAPLQVSTAATLPQTGYNYYYLVVDQNTGIIVHQTPNITTSSATTIAGLTGGTYVVYGFSVKSTAGSAPSITVGTTNISELLNTADVNGTNGSSPNCYDLSAASQPFTISGAGLLGTVVEGTQGNDGGISPFNYNVYDVYITGGAAPYNYNWSNSGFVEPGVQPFTGTITVTINGVPTVINGPGVHIQILYADEATWHLTVSDSNNCGAGSFTADNDDNNGNNGGMLDVDNYYIKGTLGTSSTGAVKLCVSGGDPGCTPSFAWSGPSSWTGASTAPANAPGATSGIIPPGTCDAGSTAYTLNGLPSGWYTVTITCGSQTTEGWYWIPKKRPGRGKDGELLNIDFIEVAPNPFNTATNIAFSTENSGNAILQLYSLEGKKLQELYNGNTQAGEVYNVSLSINDLPTGVYMLCLIPEKGQVQTTKLLFSK